MNERKKAEQIKKEKDYYFPVIVSQIICCAVTLSVFFFARSTQQWHQIKTKYSSLLQEDFLTVEFASVVSGMKDYLLSEKSAFAVFNNKVVPYERSEAEGNSEEDREKITGSQAEKPSEKKAETTTEYKTESTTVITTEDTEGIEAIKENTGEALTSPAVFSSDTVSQISVAAVKTNTVPLRLTYKKKQKMISPLIEGRYTSYFGERTDPITEGSDYHKGIDIGADEGDRIRAVYDGTVSEIGEDSRSGKYIFITHEDGVNTFYCHCSKIIAQEGEKVSQGETIALVGSTGYSTGPHLHFEVRVNGTSVDPLPLLEDAA